MPSEIFRNRAITIINTALMQFCEAAAIGHPGMQGKLRELSAKKVFEPFLPEDYRIKDSGKIIDCRGKKSNEVDLIIYSRKKLPPVMIEDEEFCFPAESVFYAIEIKSQLTATELRSAHSKAKYLNNNIEYLPGLHTPDDRAIQHPVKKAIPALFAFSSDLRRGGKNELQRYKDILEPNETTQIYSMCIVGSGYWHRKYDRWQYYPPTPNHDEVISFLSHIINTLHDISETRHFPRLGNYLMLDTLPTDVT